MKFSNQQSEIGNRKSPRSFGVTLLAVAVLTIAGLNLVRMGQALSLWNFLPELIPISPLYPAISGLIFCLVGLALAWGLWFGLGWSPKFTRLATLAYALYYWADRLLLANPPSRQVNWPFALGSTIVLLALIFWILSRRKARIYFGEMHG